MRRTSKIIALLLITSGLMQGCAGLFAAGAITTASAIHDRRTLGTQIDDQGVELKVMAALAENKAINEQAHVRVFCYNRDLLLVGQVPNLSVRSKALSIVKSIPGINTIHDELEVIEKTGVKTRTNDSWLSTKVNGTLLTNENLDPTRIKVVTENGKVYLFGMVTRAEADIATDIARNTKGVKEVVKVFQYL